MADIRSRFEEQLKKLTSNSEYIEGVLDNAPHEEDQEYMLKYIQAHPDVSISDIILMSCELGMIRDGELEPLPNE